MRKPLVCLLPLLCGCAGPAPTQVRVSLISFPITRVTVYAAPTNSIPAASCSKRGETDAQTVSPSMSGILIGIDNQISFPNGGGTAASNDVPVSFSFNKQ